MGRKVKGDFPIALGLGLLGLTGIALGLHFWGLGWFHSLVFDEIYYVPFGLDYLHQRPLFDAHPPLGKYLIAIAIALAQGPATWLGWPTIWVDDQLLSPLSYRWLNALAGSTLPLITALLAFHLSTGYAQRRRLGFSLLAGLLVILAGLPLVESRLALLNIYWVWLGLLGQLCWVLARVRGMGRSIGGIGITPWSLAAGMALGAAINVKWNGAGFWLGLVLWEVGGPGSVWPWQSQPARPWKVLAFNLGLIPLGTYSLLWLPHLGINQVSLIAVHRRLWTAHQAIGDALNPHPYCSAWYTWPLMLRPVSYFYERVEGPLPDTLLAPPGTGGIATYTVQSMGNPILWWLATAAVVALGAGQLGRWWGHRFPGREATDTGLNRRHRSEVGLPGQAHRRPATTSHPSPVVGFVLVNYGANWLPWLMVKRCTFLYHSLAMVLFSTLALAWLISRWGGDPRWHYRFMAMVMVLAMVWGFGFWLPVFIGLPLSPEALQQRWWLESWI
jgi:dolichyl-phosphate-mannose-protein mannosyltransferase